MAIRLRTQKGLYRTRVVSWNGRCLVFAAPLSRDTYIPLSIGESITIEAATESGIAVLEGILQSRDAERAEFTATELQETAYFDRRQSHRVSYGAGVSISVDHAKADLIDVSERGIRFRTSADFEKGERVAIRLPWEDQAAGAWIIDGGHMAGSNRGVNEYRAIFEDLASPPDDLSRFDIVQN